MIRRRASLRAALALGLPALALFGLPACETATAREPVAKEIPDSDRDRLIAAVRTVMSALPVPPPSYNRAPDDSTMEADRRSFWDPDAKRWTAPAQATFERVHLPGANAELPSLEYRVYLNHEPELPQGLASEGGPPRQFPISGAVAVEVTLIGAEGGRVAVSLSPEAAAAAPTVVRIYLGSREMETAVRALLGGGQLAGSIFPSVARAGEVRSIVVDLYGPKRAVETLATQVDTKALRKVLSEGAKK